jgi:ankyrin repeat protein
VYESPAETRSQREEVGSSSSHLGLRRSYDDLDGTRALLEVGADPNAQYENLGTALHHAVVRGRSREIIQLLIDRGADLEAKNPQGYTPFEVALVFGNQQAKGVLEGRSTKRELLPATQLIAACASGDRAAAEALLAKHPRLISSLSDLDRKMVTEFAALGKVDAVDLMIDLGWDLNQRGNWGGSVLQQAAWHGHVDLVDRLIQRGADLEMQNEYQGTALGATVFATEYQRVPENDTRYIAIAESLLEAGAKLLPHMLTSGNETMSEFLRTYSAGN